MKITFSATEAFIEIMCYCVRTEKPNMHTLCKNSLFFAIFKTSNLDPLITGCCCYSRTSDLVDRVAFEKIIKNEVTSLCSLNHAKIKLIKM